MCSGGNYRAPMKSEKNTTKMCLYCLLLFLWGKQSLEWLRNVLNSTIKWKTMIRPCFLCNALVLHRFIKVMKAVLLVGLAVEGPGWIGSLADDRTTPRTRTVTLCVWKIVICFYSLVCVPCSGPQGFLVSRTSWDKWILFMDGRPFFFSHCFQIASLKARVLTTTILLVIKYLY